MGLWSFWASLLVLGLTLTPCTGVTYYCPDSYDYTRHDPYADGIRVETRTSLTFQTKGRNDAHILLQNDRNNYISDVIEIVLGGWGNSQSVIRNSQQGTNRVSYSGSVLSSSSFRWFWISWDGGCIQVGEGNNVGSSRIMNWCSSIPTINGVRFSFGFGSDGYFLFESAVNGGWSNWSSFSSCPVTCGTGSVTRTRSCNNPTPAHGGTSCSGSSTDTGTCTRPTCLTYSCAPDNTITVGGFTAGTNFYAMQGSSPCTVTSSGTTITITGCTKDAEVLVTYGTYAEMATVSIHGGSSVNAFKITCNEINAAGVTHHMTNVFSASLSIDAQPTTEPTYSVTSSLSATSVTVGDAVTMTITFPSSYTMEVRECKAYPGTDDSDTTASITLVGNNGCSSSTELISNFNVASGSATATINAFKFFKSNSVFFKCKVRVCPSAGTANCVTSCPSGRRKRYDRLEDMDEDSYYLAREISNVLQVTDPSESSAVSVAPIGWIIVALAFVLYM